MMTSLPSEWPWEIMRNKPFSHARLQESVCFLHLKVEEQHAGKEKYSLLEFVFCPSPCSSFTAVLLWKFPSVQILPKK